MALSYSYMDAIGRGYPNIGAHCEGDGTVYEHIFLDEGTALPSKAELDAWILNAITSDLWDLIRAERDRRKSQGGYKVGNYWYHSDDTSRIQQIGLVMLGANLPNNIMWKTMSGDYVHMTPTLAAQIFQAAMVSDMTVFAVAEQKHTEMLASANPVDYDVLTGWPKIYGE